MAAVSTAPDRAAGPATTPETVSPPPGHPRFPLLDSLRALAALGVLAAHVLIYTQTAQRLGWGAVPANLDIGVTVFFVLSGFLLYRPFFAAELGHAPAIGLRRYAQRRVLRIVPAYWLALTVLALWPGHGAGGANGVLSGDWWRYYLFLQFYSHRTAVHGLGIAWTLCVEVAFYLVLPVYAWLTARAAARLSPGGRIRLQLALLAALGAGSVVLRVADQGMVMQNSLLTHWMWFALGMALAVGSVATEHRPALPAAVRLVARRPAWCWAVAAAVYLVMCAILNPAPQHLYPSVAQAAWQHVLSGLFALLVVAPAVFLGAGDGWPRRVLAIRGLALLGLISYGIYLWHASIAIVLISHGLQSWLPLGLITAGATVLIAGGSYLGLERPLMRAARRLR